jgi:hypothetical protein
MVRSALISILTLFSSVTGIHGQANSWRGLTPLRSTVADVERVLGKPVAERFGSKKEYLTEEGKITIRFASKLCDEGWDVSEGAVLTVSTDGKQFIGKTSKEIGLAQGQQFLMSTDVANYQAWIDPENGLSYGMSLQSHDDRFDFVVDSLNYIPTRADNSYRCDGFPPYAPERDYFTMDTPRFLNPALESKDAFFTNVAQIDNLFIHLNSNRGQNVGYALIYFDNKRPFEFYKTQLAKLKKFVYSRHPDRQEDFIFIEGGLKETAEMRLYIIPINDPPPIAKPDFASPQFMKRLKVNKR